MTAHPTGSEPTRAQRLARATLTRISEPGDPELAAFVAAHGPEAAVDAIAGEAGVAAFSAETLAGYRVRLDRADAEADLACVERVGGRLLVPGDAGWPETLAVLDGAGDVGRRGGPPLALWLRGPLSPAAALARSCAVVGARSATEYGSYVAAEIAAGLADRGIAVVSGGAFGVDSAAHRGALAAGGRTVAVLASGVDVPYPRAHEALFERIAQTGLLVSEVPPGRAPTRTRFLVRNRLIAALTRGTVVVEAALRSGALNTARWAGACGREVMGVPGPVTSMASAGVHRLIRELNATLVTDAAEVAEQIAPIGEALAPAKRGELRPRDELGPETRQVLEAVPAVHPAGVVSIAAAAAVGPDATLAALGQLLIAGYVVQEGGRWRLSDAERRRARHPRSTPGP